MASVTHITNQSQFVQSNAVFYGTNASGTIASNGISVSVNPGGGAGDGYNILAAGTQTAASTGTIAFVNSNGITFGMSNSSVITASHNGLTTAALSNHSHNFATTTTNGALIVVGTTNSDGATIGVPAFLTTAQPVGAYLTTARASNDAVGLNTAATNVTWTVNSSGISLNASAYLTTAALSNHSHGNPTLALTNLSGTTASNSAGLTLSLSAAAPGAGGGIALANSQTTYTSGTAHLVVAGGAMTIASTTGQSFNFSVPQTSSFVAVGALTLSTNGSTISISGNSVSAVPIVFSAGTTSSSLSSVVFSNSNGFSFGLNGSTITGSHNGLTTAALSDHSHNFATTTTNGSDIIVGTTNSNGVTIGVPPYLTTAQPPGAYLTTAALSNHSHNFATTTTNGSLIVVGTTNSDGATIGVPAFLTTAQAPGAYLTTAAQSNQVVNSLNGSTGQISLNVGSSLSASTNGSSITFGLASNITTALQSAGAYLTTAMQSNAVTLSNIRVSGGTTSNLLSAITFADSNGVSFGMNASTMTATVRTDYASSNHSHGNPTLALTNLSGTTASNSAGFTLSLSANSGGGVAPVASASNGSFSFTTLAFSNANNVTFGTSAGSIITASVAAPGAAAENNWFNLLGANTAGNTTGSGSTLGFSGINLTLSGTNGSVMNISAPAVSSLVGASGISISSNGSTVSVGKVLQSVYVPYMAMSTNSQTLAALGATSGSARFFPIFISDNIAFNALRVMHNLSYATSSVSGQQTISYQYGLFSNNAGTLSSISSSSMSIAVTNSSVSNTVSYPVSTGTAGYTYTTLAQTTTANIQSFWGTAAGGRPLDLQFGNSMSLSSGQYWLGVVLRHSSSSANIGISIAIGGNANALNNSLAPWGVASSAQTTNSAYRYPYEGLGAYTVSQSSLPNGVPLTQIAHTQTVMPLVSFLSTT